MSHQTLSKALSCQCLENRISKTQMLQRLWVRPFCNLQWSAGDSKFIVLYCDVKYKRGQNGAPKERRSS